MRFLPIDPGTVRSLVEGRSCEGGLMFAYTRRGLDFALHVPYTGTIVFDIPEEAEQVAGAILAGLARNDLPRRKAPPEAAEGDE